MRASRACGAGAARRARTARTARGGGTSRSRRSRRASSASSRFDGGAAKRLSANGRQSATSTRRWAGLSDGSADRAAETVLPPTSGVGSQNSICVWPIAMTSPWRSTRRPLQPLAVDVGAVAGAAVVDERPHRAAPLEVRMGARDLLVPRQRDVARRLAADGDGVAALLEHEQPLDTRGVAVEDEWLAVALGVPSRLELSRCRAVQTHPVHVLTLRRRPARRNGRSALEVDERIGVLRGDVDVASTARDAVRVAGHA